MWPFALPAWKGSWAVMSIEGLVFVECLSLAQRYADLLHGRTANVIVAWRERAATTLRRRVRFETAGAQLEGVAEDVDETGALLVRTTSATIRVTSVK